MAMSKRDYVLLASILAQGAMDRRAYDMGAGDAFEQGAEYERRDIARKIAVALAQKDPAFDPERFLHACDV